MGSLKFRKLQVEKARPILKHRQLRKIANLLHYVEECAFLVLICRLSFHLSVAVKNSNEYFFGFMVNRRFVFLIGNIIIITLFAQSGIFSAHTSAKDNSEADIYQEFIQNSTKNQMIQEEQKLRQEKQSKETQHTTEYPTTQRIRTEDGVKSQRIDSYLVKYPHKHSMKGITKTGDGIKEQRTEGCKIKWAEKQNTTSRSTNMSMEMKDYRRCESEMIERVQSENPRRVLQRCETENRGRSIQSAATERVGRTSYIEDEVSDEEFHRTIEAFIARHQRRRRQEQCFAA